jgi:glutamate dehydrogenase
LSYQRLQTFQPLTDKDLHDKIRKTVSNKHELQVLEALLIFNRCVLWCFAAGSSSDRSRCRNVLKTNFYQPTKVALSFRLSPEFLPEIEYPRKPHGMFVVIGNEFRGFHLRFRDVARGGIRIVMSRNRENYSINQRMLCVSCVLFWLIADADTRPQVR